jgi:hypothetical protein
MSAMSAEDLLTVFWPELIDCGEVFYLRAMLWAKLDVTALFFKFILSRLIPWDVTINELVSNFAGI